MHALACIPHHRTGWGRGARLAVVVALVVAVVQIGVPLRHLAIAGDVRWSEEGYRWSWRVLVTERSGVATFRVTDPETGRVDLVFPTDDLAAHQATYVSSRPEALRQYAHHLADRWEHDHGRRPEVRVDAWVSVNGSERARIVDPTVDLASESSSVSRPPWVRPAPWEPTGDPTTPPWDG